MGPGWGVTKPFPQHAFVTEYTFEQWVQGFEVNEGLVDVEN
jgi:hypothetical protein